MVALIQSKNHAANKGKTAGRYQFDIHPTGIGLKMIFCIGGMYSIHGFIDCFCCWIVADFFWPLS